MLRRGRRPRGHGAALLLARSGIDVTVLEKRGDFLRDFRGDTVHPSTPALLDDLGLAERVARLPQRRVRTVQLRCAGLVKLVGKTKLSRAGDSIRAACGPDVGGTGRSG